MTSFTVTPPGEELLEESDISQPIVRMLLASDTDDQRKMLRGKVPATKNRQDANYPDLVAGTFPLLSTGTVSLRLAPLMASPQAS